MIFVGTNDYKASVPLGEWFTEEVVEVEVIEEQPIELKIEALTIAI